MLLYSSMCFLALGFFNIFLIILSSDTKGMHPTYASRMHALNKLCVEYVSPVIAIGALLLIPTVIILGV